MHKTLKNSGNSSLPPSHNLYHLKNQSLRETSNKKTGGQPGHKGETLLMSPNLDKTIDHQPNEIFPQCGKEHTDLSGQIIGKRQVIDIRIIKAIVIEHGIIQTTCICGYIGTENFPSNVSALYNMETI